MEPAKSKSRTFRAVVPYVTCALRALVPHLPRVVRVVKQHVPRALVASCFTYLIPYILNCYGYCFG